MIRRLLLPALLLMAALLAACSTAATGAEAVQQLPPTEHVSDGTGQASAELARTDAQGSVEFVVTPLNLAAPSETLDFTVVMDTHSVDLAWNLAAQSRLRTDTGAEVIGLSWPVGSGHHYEGTLTFPAAGADGRPVLQGASRLTLTIEDTDVSTRVFEWDLTQ